MKSVFKQAFTAALVLAAGGTAAPAMADRGFERAHSLHSLDIMLMVTALRCRSSGSDFQEDYYRFATVHRDALRRAGAKLRDVFESGSDGGNPDRALDRMGVVIANSYGGGHPWLGCEELGQIVRVLALASDEEALMRAAHDLLGSEPVDGSVPRFGQLDKPDTKVRISYSDVALSD